jgi:arylsulfatase A-like enzyme
MLSARMKTRSILVSLFASLCLLGGHSASAALAGKQPNIVFFFTDDQGYGDISAHGNPVLKTPNLDRIRTEGTRFENFMVSPTCSPTRSALFTGRHEFKNGITHTILERERLTLKATTLAQVLKSASYTTGIFGKWHLGDEAEYQPNRRGFDEVYIHGGGGIGQTYPGSCGDAPGNKYFDPALLHNGKFEKTKGYCTDLFYAQATKWMDEKRKAKKPFFAYIPSNAPHGPYIARPEDKALFEGKNLGADTENFFGMIHNIDENVGKVLAKLDEWGIAKDTLVVFMNDNGGTAGVKVFNAGMRGSKGSAWVGGTRASSFWRWPGTLKPAEVKALAAHIDFFPTLAEIAGAKLSAEVKQQVEGRSLVPLLENAGAPWADRYLFAHQGRWPKFSDPNEAKFKMTSVRNTRWAMVSEDGGREPNWQLFDLSVDYGQQKNVFAEHPAVVKELAAAFDKWWSECLPLMVNEKAVGPKLNPFAEIYWKQFGGGPTEADYKRMDPTQPWPAAGAAGKAGKKKR